MLAQLQWRHHAIVSERCQVEPVEQRFSELADYARQREARERSAAKRAKTLEARRTHQELAQYYAQLVRR